MAAEDGILALAYEQDQFGLGPMQRFGQLVVYYMFHPSSAMFGGSLAMSDGAAYTIKRLLETGKYTPEMKARLLEIADKCPVHRTLESGAHVVTELGTD